MNEVSSQSVHWVAHELNATLQEARRALESYVEHSEHPETMEECGSLMHTAQGALRMVEIYGAALLAEEMEAVVAYLIEHQSEPRRRTEGLEALTRAMVQLPAYLDRVVGGGRDVPLILLPLLNDLRAVRGNPLLSEGTLVLLNLSADQATTVAVAGKPPSDVDIAALAKKLRPKFQLNLLKWIRGENADVCLKAMGDVAAPMEAAAGNQSVYQIWWIVGGVIEALREGGLEPSVAVKRLLGQADRIIKRLVDGGEQSLVDDPPADLENNLLYYVARASSGGERVSAIRRSFNLGELFPEEDQIDVARESLSAPSTKLMKTVGAAIKEDLTKVKDVLDIYVRTGMSSVDDLSPQLEMLKKIADTLGVLGLGNLRGDVQGEIAQLQEIVLEKIPPDEATLLRIAQALLGVEDSLDEQLVRLIVPTGRFRQLDEEADGEESEDTEYRQVTGAVLRECTVNLARIKEAIVHSVAKPEDPGVMDPVPQLVRGITAGLLMLSKTRAVSLIERIGEVIQQRLRPEEQSLTADQLDRLADAVVSLEYYMETIQAGRNDPFYMLDNAQASLEALAAPPVPMPIFPPARPAEEAEPTVRLDEPAAEQAGATDVLPAAFEAPVMAGKAEKLDPEFLELFIEEAKEEVVSIRNNFPSWVEDRTNAEALVTVRRSFHTLKGSGRMVGAQLIGEFAWAFENLLNRIIDRTLNRTPEIIKVITRAAAALPELIEQLEVGAEPVTDIEAILQQAHELAGFDPSKAPLLRPRKTKVLPVTARPEKSDPVLLEIYAKETDGHLDSLRAFIKDSAQGVAPYAVTEVLNRACHTLCGSAQMAGIKEGVALAEPLYRYVRSAYDEDVSLPAEALPMLEHVIAAFETMLATLDRIERPMPDHSDLFAEIDALQEEVETTFLAARATEAAAEITLETEVVTPKDEERPPATPEEDHIETSIAPETEKEPGGEVPAPTATESPADSGTAAAAEVDYDPEIASIFSEEASELLEAAQRAFKSWSSDPGNKDELAELKRQLHTLKGGARMARIEAMGNLSHELETLVNGVDEGVIGADAAVIETVQKSLDTLHSMRDKIAVGTAVKLADDDTKRIRAVIAQHALHAAESREEASPAGPEDIEIAELAAAFDAFVSTAATETSTEAEVPAEPEEKFDVGGETVVADESEPVQEPVVEQVEEQVEEPVEEAVAEREPVADQKELARVDAELLEELLNSAGEISIYRARLGQQISSIDFNLKELSQTVLRLKEQLRRLEIETEKQILHRHQDEKADREDFDPLELDRYSTIQQLSRALAESVSDVDSLQQLLRELTRDADTLLVQQSRIATEIQNGLMRTRMVPFQRQAQRLGRIVRQTASECGKRAELALQGEGGELDRQVLERMLPPFEHLVRNAVIHGIETPRERAAAGKPDIGKVSMGLRREGSEVVVELADDGAGLNVGSIRRKAEMQGLIPAGASLPADDVIQLIFEPGFSTATRVTQSAGRGVGLDVVATEVKQLGGSLNVKSDAGKGTRFVIRLPFTLAITHALLVRIADQLFALPLPAVGGIARVSRADLERHLAEDVPTFAYGDQVYRFRYLAQYLGLKTSAVSEDESSISVILIRAGDNSTALVVDEMLGSREIVVKSVGPQIASIRGIAGATILGDGSIVIILDAISLVRGDIRAKPPSAAPIEEVDQRTFVLVVDDSITVRRVTQRLLERNGMRVMTAKDGVDAVSIMQENKPDIILLDIEMPRMDGYEVAAHVRGDSRLKGVPIIIITSRVGEKHQKHAYELGVDDYLGKPYQESQLLEAIAILIGDEGARVESDG